jgi:hypothetical protein
MDKVLETIFQRMLCAAIITLLLPFVISAQQKDKIIDWQPVLIMSEARVLEIADIKVDGKSITVGQPFIANEDWLNTLTFKVRNTSGKVINHFGFGVAFPEIDANGHTPMFSITYNANSSKRDFRTRKPLLPDEEVDLKLPEDQIEIMRRVSMNTSGTANLNKVNILPGLVTFADGSSMGGLSLRRRVPVKP